jgi:ribonuclease VapC
VIPLSEEHARAATRAFLRYGKGRHPAGLNFGDCMAYAVAQVEGAPLLFIERISVGCMRRWVKHPP